MRFLESLPVAVPATSTLHHRAVRTWFCSSRLMPWTSSCRQLSTAFWRPPGPAGNVGSRRGDRGTAHLAASVTWRGCHFFTSFQPPIEYYFPAALRAPGPDFGLAPSSGTWTPRLDRITPWTLLALRPLGALAPGAAALFGADSASDNAGSSQLWSASSSPWPGSFLGHSAVALAGVLGGPGCRRPAWQWPLIGILAVAIAWFTFQTHDYTHAPDVRPGRANISGGRRLPWTS